MIRGYSIYKSFSSFKKMIFGIGFGGGKNHFFERQKVLNSILPAFLDLLLLLHLFNFAGAKSFAPRACKIKWRKKMTNKKTQYLDYRKATSLKARGGCAKISPSLLPKKGGCIRPIQCHIAFFTRASAPAKSGLSYGQSSAGALANTTYHTLNTATNPTSGHSAGVKAS